MYPYATHGPAHSVIPRRPAKPAAPRPSTFPAVSVDQVQPSTRLVINEAGGQSRSHVQTSTGTSENQGPVDTWDEWSQSKKRRIGLHDLYDSGESKHPSTTGEGRTLAQHHEEGSKVKQPSRPSLPSIRSLYDQRPRPAAPAAAPPTPPATSLYIQSVREGDSLPPLSTFPQPRISPPTDLPFHNQNSIERNHHHHQHHLYDLTSNALNEVNERQDINNRVEGEGNPRQRLNDRMSMPAGSPSQTMPQGIPRRSAAGPTRRFAQVLNSDSRKLTTEMIPAESQLHNAQHRPSSSHPVFSQAIPMEREMSRRIATRNRSGFSRRQSRAGGEINDQGNQDSPMEARDRPAVRSPPRERNLVGHEPHFQFPQHLPGSYLTGKQVVRAPYPQQGLNRRDPVGETHGGARAQYRQSHRGGRSQTGIADQLAPYRPQALLTPKDSRELHQDASNRPLVGGGSKMNKRTQSDGYSMIVERDTQVSSATKRIHPPVPTVYHPVHAQNHRQQVLLPLKPRLPNQHLPSHLSERQRQSIQPPQANTSVVMLESHPRRHPPARVWMNLPSPEPVLDPNGKSREKAKKHFENLRAIKGGILKAPPLEAYLMFRVRRYRGEVKAEMNLR